MRILVTGSAGHLGEALMRTLRARGDDAVGIDIQASAFTDHVGSIADAAFVDDCAAGIDAILHAATLHKPHVASHRRQQFVDTNITGTLNLLEAARRYQVRAFVFTSTTSVFGDAMVPAPGAPATWITEEVTPLPKNIYGVTKLAAEELCRLFHRNQGFPCVVLRTSRFFAEADDNKRSRESFEDANLKANELLYRRADLQDVVDAHLHALARADDIGFGRYIISATTPFSRGDLAQLAQDADAVVNRHFPRYRDQYARRGWRMLPKLDRVYINDAAREALGWTPRYDFDHVLRCLEDNSDYRSPLALSIGCKGYHDEAFIDMPYPVERDSHGN